LPRQVRRAVRCGPRPDAVQREGRLARALRAAPQRPRQEGADRLCARGHRAVGSREEPGGERPVSIINEPQGVTAAEGSYESELPVLGKRPGSVVVKWLTTTDHKTIGTMYLTTSFIFFVIGGIMALVMRAELARPGLQILSNEQFNQAFTMHGTLMLLMFATPLF